MANNTTIKDDNESPPSECFSARSDIHLSIGTNLDPIVLDDDSSDDTAQKRGNLSRKKPQSTRYKRKRISSSADDTNGTSTPPRRFTEILQPEPADEEVMRLNDEIASIQAENFRLESARSEDTIMINTMGDEIAALKTTVVTTKTLVEEYEVLKPRFEESETNVSKLKEELEHFQRQNIEATETRESVQKELMAQRQLGQAQETELADTKNTLRDSQKALQTAQNQASLATQHLKKAREERFEANLAVSTLRVDCNKLSSELAKARRDCAIIPTLRSNLTATFEAFSQTQARGSELESQLQERENEKATLDSRIVELETQQKEYERVTAKLRDQLTEIKCDKSMLEDDQIKLVASNATVEKKRKALQSSVNGMTKAHEAMKLQRDRLQREMKESTDEREQLSRRLKGLEDKGLELTKAMNIQTAELALAKQNVSRLATANSNLKAAQQQVEEMEDHMARCPMARNPKEFYEDFYRRLDQLDEDIELVRNDLAANPLL